MIETSEDTADLYAALIAAQAEMDAASKSAANPHFRSKYVPLDEVINAARPALAKHGLGFVQAPQVDGRGVTLATRIIHKSGQWIENRLSMPIEKLTPQAIGSAISYSRRYSLQAVLGIAAEDDDDGEAAMGRPSVVQPKTKAVARKDGDYQTLEAEIRACETVDELRRWGKENGSRIGLLPETWQDNLRFEFEDQIARLKTMNGEKPVNLLAAG